MRNTLRSLVDSISKNKIADKHNEKNKGDNLEIKLWAKTKLQQANTIVKRTPTSKEYKTEVLTTSL